MVRRGGGEELEGAVAWAYLEHGRGLAGVDHEEDLVIPSLHPHLLEGICQLNVGDLFRILQVKSSLQTLHIYWLIS